LTAFATKKTSEMLRFTECQRTAAAIAKTISISVNQPAVLWVKNLKVFDKEPQIFH